MYDRIKIVLKYCRLFIRVYFNSIFVNIKRNFIKLYRRVKIDLKDLFVEISVEIEFNEELVSSRNLDIVNVIIFEVMESSED